MDLSRFIPYFAPKPLSSVSESDDVYQLHPLDDTKMARYMVSWLMRFNDVLDADQLHAALSRLLEIGDWKKIGGRLRHKVRYPMKLESSSNNANGVQNKQRLEIHVPKHYSAERPPIAYFHETLYDTSYEQHALARHLPRATAHSSVHPHSVDFRPLIAIPGMPTTFNGMIDHDVPQLSLRITSFEDATFVALSWPHTLMDGTGAHALLQAWSSVLAGKEQDVPAVLGAKDDIVSQAINTDDGRAHEELVLESQRLTGLSKLAWLFRVVRDLLWRPKLEQRTIFLPRAVFARMRSSLHEQMALEYPAEKRSGLVFGDSDIIAPWIARMVALSEPRPRPVTLSSIYNARYRVPMLNMPGGVYCQNMLLLTILFLPMKTATGALGPIAVAHRQHLVDQATEQHTLSLLRDVYRILKLGKAPRILYGPSDAVPLLCNNLTKIRVVRAVDFAPAISRPGESVETRNNPPGTMVGFTVHGSPVPVNSMEILGKDFGDNFWVTTCLRPKAWSLIERELEDEVIDREGAEISIKS